jgi:hypothetical protein
LPRPPAQRGKVAAALLASVAVVEFADLSEHDTFMPERILP